MRKLEVVVGAQYGSEGKGAVAAHLAGHGRPMLAIRVAGPNAGHTVIHPGTGQAFALRSIPVAAVVNPNATLLIAAGSEVDGGVLGDEIYRLETAGIRVRDRLYVHRQATVLNASHRAIETASGLVGAIGSTGKGIGAARASRVMRDAGIWGSSELGDDWPPMSVDQPDWQIDGDEADQILTTNWDHVQIEGTQGYGLGLHTGYYPQCTSSDTRAIDFLAMAGINPWTPGWDLRIYACARTYPIRVAGNSGPLKDETDWATLGQDPELTTVTRKVRRVGMWDQHLVNRAVAANGGAPAVRLALTMVDYDYPLAAGEYGPIPFHHLPNSLMAKIDYIEQEAKAPIELLGTGPDTMLEVVR